MLAASGVLADDHMLPGDRNSAPSVRVNDQPEFMLLLDSSKNPAIKNQNILGRMHSEPERPLTAWRSLEPPPTANYRSCPEIGEGSRSEEAKCRYQIQQRQQQQQQNQQPQQQHHQQQPQFQSKIGCRCVRKYCRNCPPPVTARPAQAHLWNSSGSGIRSGS